VRIRLAALGDVGLIGAVRRGIERHGPAWMLEAVAPAFEGVDVTLFNLEMPFAPPQAHRPSHVREEFRVPPALASALSFPGVRIACLANNHVMDFGLEGLRTTRATLAAAGILDVGAGEDTETAGSLRVVDVRGQRLGVLAFAQPGPHTSGPGACVAAADPDAVVQRVRSARAKVDLLVVQLHHGAMYVDVPTPEGRQLARAAASAGADLVLGHHPHVVQGVERVGTAVIAHSLGEFVFDATVGHVLAHAAAEKRRESFVLRVDIDEAGVAAERIPVRMASVGRPELPDAEASAAMRARFDALDRMLSVADYEGLFRDNAATNLAGHEMRVLMSALRRGDFGYLLGKVSRIRPRHLRVLASLLRRRLSPFTRASR
jgi:hypothetical protein